MEKRAHFRWNIIHFALVISAILTWSSCGSDEIDMFDCTGLGVTYTDDIKSILDVSCAKSGCHDAQTAENGFDFSSYSEAKLAISAGSFLGAIQHKKGFEAMPNDASKLSDDKIKLLTCWVQNGTPE